MKRRRFKILFFAVLFIVILINFLSWANSLGGTPFRKVSSYGEIQDRFRKSVETEPVYPDIAVLKLDKSTIRYKVYPYMLGERDSAVYRYDIEGSRSIQDKSISFTFACIKDSDDINDDNPLLYNGTGIRLKTVTEHYPFVSAEAAINGYGYYISAHADQWSEYTEAELAELHKQLEGELYSFICGIIDEASTQ